jgi:hypothetical protein
MEYIPTSPSLSDIYAKTHSRAIPFHKSGKRIIFLKSEIDAWLFSNQSKRLKQLTEEAENIADHDQHPGIRLFSFLN